MSATIYDTGLEELHEGIGTGLVLTTDEILAAALAILEPSEPYYELHPRTGTGLELTAGEVVREAEAIMSWVWKAIFMS